MNIPRTGKERERAVKRAIEKCAQSMPGRARLYDMRRRWFLWGNDSELPVRCNRLMSHTSLVSSFLYSEEHVRFGITGGSDKLAATQYEPLAEHMQTVMRDSALVYQFGEALLWSLVYDSMFLKLGWQASRDELFAKIVDPYAIGVYDEAEPELDDQEAFIHVYHLSWQEAVARVKRSGQADLIKRLGKTDEPTKERYPSVLENLIIAQSPAQNPQGNVIGEATTDISSRATYAPETSHDMVRFTELWAWDFDAQDYARFVMAEPDILISDSRDIIEGLAARQGKSAEYGSAINDFFPREHPFVHVKPYSIYDYFWGECHTERLIPLQKWSTERLDQIADILALQVDPPAAVTGFGGLTDEKMDALNGPGAWVYDASPTGKIDRWQPPVPKELFAEFNEIGDLFLEASGLTKTIAGQGSSGVRSEDQVRQLASMGGGRIKKTAISVEKSLSRMGQLAWRLLSRNDDTRLKTAEGIEFVIAQMEGDIHVRVAGHSHSPLFADETMKKAEDLFKASAIDKESLLKLVNPPNVETLVDRLRKREAQERAAAAQGAVLPGTKEAAERQRSHHGAAKQ